MLRLISSFTGSDHYELLNSILASTKHGPKYFINPDEEIKDNNSNVVINKIDINNVENRKINNFNRYLKNLLLDKSIIQNNQYIQSKKNELPPSAESILDKFFEYNKIILFKNIDTSDYKIILDNIEQI
jgi:hypothetical protein